MKTLLLASLTLLLAAYFAIPAANASRLGAHTRQKTMSRRIAPRPATLSDHVNLAGRVILPDGSPASGAAVYLSWTTQNNTVQFVKVPVDAGGNFKQTAKLASVQRSSSVGVAAVAAGHGSDWVLTTMGSRSLSNLKLCLSSGISLEGRLVRVNGLPAANTEIHADALFPTGIPNSPVAAQLNSVSLGQFAGGMPQQIQYDFMMRLYPDGITPTLYHTRTDAGGRFTLTGLPRRTTLLLRPGSGLALTPASMAPLALGPANRQDAGILVATRTGSARIRVIDSGTHKPAANVYAVMSLSDNAARGPVLFHAQPPFTISSAVTTDQNGVVEMKNLLPGTYSIAIEGRVQQIKVSEGMAAQADFALRQGPLNGRLLDSAGKPLANVEIMAKTGGGLDENVVSVSDEGLNRFNNFDGRGFFDGWERRALARTGLDGTFSIPNFPWGAAAVIVRATRNNDRAEYIGPVSTIGERLDLRLRSNALVSVTGRLVDPHRRVLSNLSCQALHWQKSPRQTWFASAHALRADAHGRFRVDGLERGESFSIISNDQRAIVQQQAPAQSTSVKTVSLSTVSPVNQFESPRFVSKRDGIAQELGDVMVHPSNTPDEVLQSYGAGRREVVSAGVIEAPDPHSVEQARAALKRYRLALRSGDVTAVQRLTSRLSPSYAAQLPDFLLHSSLSGVTRAGAQDEAMRPMRFVPRSVVGRLTARPSSTGASANINAINAPAGRLSAVQSFDGLQNDAMPSPILQKDPKPDLGDNAFQSGRPWVVLTTSHEGIVVLAGILHYEEGQWRVLPSGMPPNASLTSLIGLFGDSPPLTTADYTKQSSVIPMDQFVPARRAGERYLRLWGQNRADAMRTATSQFSFSYAPDLAQFISNQERRPDQGICPLNPENAFSLEPITRLTVWDQKSLGQMAHVHGFVARFFGGFRSPFSGGDLFSNDALKRGDIALFQYNTPVGRFAMALVRNKNDGHNQWKVLEPALPL